MRLTYAMDSVRLVGVTVEVVDDVHALGSVVLRELRLEAMQRAALAHIVAMATQTGRTRRKNQSHVIDLSAPKLVQDFVRLGEGAGRYGTRDELWWAHRARDFATAALLPNPIQELSRRTAWSEPYLRQLRRECWQTHGLLNQPTQGKFTAVLTDKAKAILNKEEQGQ